jgi:hypothetical protein
MKMVRKTSVGTKGTHAVNVLLAYDNLHNCAAMLNLLDRISTRMRDKKLFNVNAVKFGLLEHMDPLNWTASDADAIELAMVAFSEEGAPRAGFLRWLESWAKRQAGKEAGLGLLPMGPHTGRSVRRVVRSLRGIAARNGLGFICDAETTCPAPC